MKKLFLLFLFVVSAAYGEEKYIREEYITKEQSRIVRMIVLSQESLEPVVFNKNGTIISGLWLDSYTGEYIQDPKLLQVDHVVPLKYAHIYGAKKWNAEQKQAFAMNITDPNHLIAVRKEENNIKSDKGPGEWMPPNKKFHDKYREIFAEILDKYELAK